MEGLETATAAAAVPGQSSAKGVPALVAQALADAQAASLQHLIDSSAAGNVKLGEAQARARNWEKKYAALLAQFKKLQEENRALRHRLNHPFGIGDIPR
jgi:hypothetical protein